MKRIFIPFFATAALLASCSDWTEVEHRDLLPQMNQSDPVFSGIAPGFQGRRTLGDDDDRPRNLDCSESAEPASYVYA